MHVISFVRFIGLSCGMFVMYVIDALPIHEPALGSCLHVTPPALAPEKFKHL